jgi:hypothetical protein
MRNVCSRPLSLRRRTVVPNDASVLSAGGLTSSALDRRARQYRTSLRADAAACLIAVVDRSPVGRLEANESAFDRPQTFRCDEVSMRRYRTIGKVRRLVVGFLDEGAAHCVLPVLHRSSPSRVQNRTNSESDQYCCRAFGGTTASVTSAIPEKPNARAPAGVRSITRPGTNGPRSLMRTSAVRPF